MNRPLQLRKKSWKTMAKKPVPYTARSDCTSCTQIYYLRAHSPYLHSVAAARAALGAAVVHLQCCFCRPGQQMLGSARILKGACGSWSPAFPWQPPQPSAHLSASARQGWSRWCGGRGRRPSRNRPYQLRTWAELLWCRSCNLQSKSKC